MVRRRRSRAKVEALVAEVEASGLMRAAFCQERRLAVGTLDKYRRRVQGKPRSVRDESTMVLMCRFYDLWRDEGLPPSEALRNAQRWVRDTTNGEKVEYFKGSLQEFAGIGTRMAADTADSLYKLFSIRDPEARDLSHPFHWAAFCYVGV